MDTVTQIVLGGTIAEAGFRKQLGKKSILFGAFCGWFPDIDIFFHSGGWEEMVAHRGLTHSLLFLPIIAPVMGELGYRFSKKKGTRWAWTQLAFWALVTHPLLDWNTAYGTQLMYPFSNHRFALDSIGIVDLFYTVPLIMAMYFGLRTGYAREKSRTFAQKALLGSTAYLLLAFGCTQMAMIRVESALGSAGFTPTVIRCNPPPLFSPLRRVVAMNAQGDIAVSIVHVLSSEIHIDQKKAEFIEEKEQLLATTEGEIFDWYTDGILVVENHPEHVILRAAQYGLFSNIWSSPFAAKALRTDTGFAPLVLLPRTEQMDMGTELSIGFRKSFFLDMNTQN